jgi:hypothetical protein
MCFRSMQIPVSIRASYNMADIKALVDSGATNGHADALLRRPDYDQGEHDNANVTVLPDQLFI